MLKFPCLVLDHDDTVVRSEATVNYPCFCETMSLIRPDIVVTVEDYARGCSELGFVDMCKQWYNFTQKELDDEYIAWKQYSQKHRPTPVPGICNIIKRQKAEGGKLFVVSHSAEEMILRDYKAYFEILPDQVYGCDAPPEQQKPSPYPILNIMEKYSYKPEEIFVVDDMKPGWEMARATGVKIGFAGWDRRGFPNIYNEMTKLCDYTFNTVTELGDFLF